MDQIAIACAFCTGAGVELLRRHARRLKSNGSFVVVSWERPTDFEALEELHAAAPGHLYVHFGGARPEETQVGRPLMHTKLFYARRGRTCWLWTGSHNLTASATQGINDEAAILIEADMGEETVADAYDHLLACRNEAALFVPGMHGPPEPKAASQATLIIHAECSASVASFPWHIQLRVRNESLDDVLAPPGQVRLYLYDPGALTRGWQNAKPRQACGGIITGLNFTASHPAAAGIAADWAKANYIIDQIRGIPTMTVPSSLPAGTMTQSLMRIDELWTSDEVWLSEKPKTRMIREHGPDSRLTVDNDMRQFFKSSSREGDQVIYRPIVGIKKTLELPKEEVRPEAADILWQRLQGFASPQVSLIESQSKDIDAFIYRRKYRL